jgi:hypothetical protein
MPRRWLPAPLDLRDIESLSRSQIEASRLLIEHDADRRRNAQAN